ARCARKRGYERIGTRACGPRRRHRLVGASAACGRHSWRSWVARGEALMPTENAPHTDTDRAPSSDAAAAGRWSPAAWSIGRPVTTLMLVLVLSVLSVVAW